MASLSGSDLKKIATRGEVRVGSQFVGVDCGEGREALSLQVLGELRLVVRAGVCGDRRFGEVCMRDADEPCHLASICIILQPDRDPLVFPHARVHPLQRAEPRAIAHALNTPALAGGLENAFA